MISGREIILKKAPLTLLKISRGISIFWHYNLKKKLEEINRCSLNYFEARVTTHRPNNGIPNIFSVNSIYILFSVHEFSISTNRQKYSDVQFGYILGVEKRTNNKWDHYENLTLSEFSPEWTRFVSRNTRVSLGSWCQLDSSFPVQAWLNQGNVQGHSLCPLALSAC
jgi:hypothetical protein